MKLEANKTNFSLQHKIILIYIKTRLNTLIIEDVQ